MARGDIEQHIRLDVVDHIHGDDAVPMDVVEDADGQAEDGTGWFRYVFACRRSDCSERFALVLRVKLTIDGEVESRAVR